MYASAVDDFHTFKQVGALWGLNVKGVIGLYFDADKGKHCTCQVRDGMCGSEKVWSYMEIPHDGVVTMDDGSQFRVVYNSDDVVPMGMTKVGVLWGLNVLGVKNLYLDVAKGKHCTIDTHDGMCGREEVVSYLNIPSDGVVTMDGGLKFRVKYKAGQPPKI